MFLTMLIIGLGFWIWKGHTTSNIHNYQTIGEIPTPTGYERINPDDGFAQYLRSMSLKKRGSTVKLYTGGVARFQSLCYAVVDLPLLSNDEQCADICMRLRAEYLYNIGGLIHFNNVGGKAMRFPGGSRKNFEKYLKKVYGSASTFSLSRELPTRVLKDIQPGDVFVYAGVDRGQKMGHAVMVVDVAQNNEGKKIFMVAEGNTPARELHIIRNWFNPFQSPWFTLDENSDFIQISPFTYKAKELRYWN